MILNGLTLTGNCHAKHICDSLPTESMDGTFPNYADYKLDYKPGKDMLDLHLWYSIRAFHLYTNIILQMIVSAFTINTG